MRKLQHTYDNCQNAAIAQYGVFNLNGALQIKKISVIYIHLQLYQTGITKHHESIKYSPMQQWYATCMKGNTNIIGNTQLTQRSFPTRIGFFDELVRTECNIIILSLLGFITAARCTFSSVDCEFINDVATQQSTSRIWMIGNYWNFIVFSHFRYSSGSCLCMQDMLIVDAIQSLLENYHATADKYILLHSHFFHHFSLHGAPRRCLFPSTY